MYKLGLLLITSVLISNAAFSQIFVHGSIIDPSDTTYIQYANIGIKGKNLGTVSNDRGSFELAIPETFVGDTLLFTAHGYESLAVLIDADMDRMDVLMSPLTFELTGIQLKASRPKRYRLGRMVRTRMVKYGFRSFQPGAEIATKISAVSKPGYIESVGFHLTNCDMDSISFRFNIYSVGKDGRPGEQLLKWNIFLDPDCEPGIYEFDLIDYEIYLDQEVFVTLEWYREQEDTSELMFASYSRRKDSYARSVAHGDWDDPLTFSIGIWLNMIR